MLIRVRTNVGLWRIEVDEVTATTETLKEKIASERPHVVYTPEGFALDPAGKRPLDIDKPLRDQGVKHGTMVHCRVDPATCVTTKAASSVNDNSDGNNAQANGANNSGLQHFRRVIGKDGSIHMVPTSEAPTSGSDKGFRKGMMALRDMKMSWTLNDFIALDSQFEFKIVRQEKAFAQQVSLDVPSISNFQAYCQRFNFQRKRFAFLYGKYVKAEEEDEKPTKVQVEAIYEPPQDIDPDCPEGFTMPDDPNEAAVETISKLLGLQRVGWVFCHGARDKYALSGAETILAAELQLEAAGGVEETPFCTVTVAPKPDGSVAVEAYQVSQQCLSMVAEEALQADHENEQVCKVNETFTAIQEGKASPTVETDFFVTVVPIAQHTSETFIADFPRANRDHDTVPNKDALKQQLSKANTNGWTLNDRLADFNLLLFLQQFFDLEGDMPQICASLVEKTPLNDGYKLLIASLAGLDGAY